MCASIKKDVVNLYATSVGLHCTDCKRRTHRTHDPEEAS